MAVHRDSGGSAANALADTPSDRKISMVVRTAAGRQCPAATVLRGPIFSGRARYWMV